MKVDQSRSLTEFDYGMKIRKGNKYDENVVIEVITKHCYRRKNINFDVEKGETWLDLGGNIGAFAKYCELRGAYDCHSYEPDEQCYSLLSENSIYWSDNSCVTGEKKKFIMLYQHSNQENNTRGSIYELRSYRSKEIVPNTYCGSITETYDGVKMGIEGSEFKILDLDLLPKCDKLVLEYHSSRDSSVNNLRRRLYYLHDKFNNVKYPPEFDRVISSGEKEFKSFFDRLIFCWN